jgi:hypothetical protein
MLSSKKMSLYGSPVTVADYIKLMLTIVFLARKLKGKSAILSTVKIKNIEVSSLLDVTIYIEVGCC